MQSLTSFAHKGRKSGGQAHLPGPELISVEIVIAPVNGFPREGIE